MAKRLGIIAQAYAQPLFVGLQNRRDGMFDLTVRAPSELALSLRQRQLDGAFLSPIDYAKDYAMYRIVPDAGVVSRNESGTVVLVFKKNMRSINTLAIDPRSSSEIVLASIILAEKYDLRPKLIPWSGTLDEALIKTDSALVVGDAVLTMSEHSNTIDLVDEWTDITELPFVHGVWVAREQAFSDDELRAIIKSSQPSVKPELFTNQAPPDYFEYFQYILDEESKSALAEFFRMAYFHGILNDITDVKFHSLSTQ